MQPIIGLMIMGEHNEAINNQCAFRHNVGGGIAMVVLQGVVIASNWCHVKNGAAPPNPPHHTLLRSLNHTLCDPFEHRQIVQLVGLVLMVVAPPIVAIHCVAGPFILWPAHNGGVLIENGCLLLERHPLKITQKTVELHITQKIMLQQAVHHQLVPGGDHKIIWIPIPGPHGLCRTHFLGLPNKEGWGASVEGVRRNLPPFWVPLEPRCARVYNA